jgi:SAM-dependent methyltransferase
MAFFQRDLVGDEWRGRHERYDSIFVNALLHHLSYEELAQVFERIRDCLKPGGRVYLYEPLLPDAPRPARRPLFDVIDFCWRAVMFAYMRGGRALGWFDHRFRAAMKAGYTGISPDEHPIELSRLRAAWKDEFELLECRPFHQYGIAYAMAIMLLPASRRRPLEPLARWINAADRRLFRFGMWESTGSKGRWVLCAVKLRAAAKDKNSEDV